MSRAHAQVLRLRLFLEGVEVPVIAASIQCMPNSPSIATIQIPPLAEGTRFHPRTTVHLFILDIYRKSPALADTERAALDDEKAPSMHDRAQEREGGQLKDYDLQGASLSGKDLRNSDWKLFFGGEMVGFTWTKSPGGRSLILQCEDWSNYWDYAYQAGNTGIFGPGLKAVFSGASTNLFTDFLTSKGSVLTRIVASGKCNTFPKLKGLAAGIIRLLEAVGGSYYVYPGANKNKPPKRLAGQNIFFSYNELRLHLTQMVGTIEKDTTSERILRRQGYSGMFNRAIGGQGGQVSIRKAITALTKIMFYEMYPQSCPKYKPGYGGEVAGTRRVKLGEHPIFGPFSSKADDVMVGLADVHSQLESFSFDSQGEGDNPTKRVRDLGKNVASQLTAMHRSLLQTRAKMVTAGVPNPAPAKLSSVGRIVGGLIPAMQSLGRSFVPSSMASMDSQSMLQSTQQRRSNPGQAFSGPPRRLKQARGSGFTSTTKSQTKKIQAALLKITEAIEILLGISDQTVDLSTGRDRHPSQLFQQVFRPDVWFSAPPRCNVLFPESYDQLSYQRSFLKEPTRFLLKTNNEFYGEDILFDKLYFAPQAGTVKKDKARMTDMLRKDLLSHERFTGILPVFEKMGEFNVFASRAEGRRDEAIKKVGLAQRSANFIYFRHRFNARRMTVSGKLNPYVATGFPGLVIDKYVDAETIARHKALQQQKNLSEIEIGQTLGTNFLGNFTQVVHQATQQGPSGKTQLTMSFPRQPEESIEYLGTVPEELRVRKRQDGSEARPSYIVASFSQPKLGSLGLNQGRVVTVHEVTSDFPPQNIGGKLVGYEFQLMESATRRSNQYTSVEVPVDVEVTASDLKADASATVGALLGGSDIPVRFKAYLVTEEVPRYKLEEVLLPAEEYIRPGWYGEVWTNSKIGTAYEELLSTGSITDPHTVNDFGRSNAELHSEAEQQAASEAQEAENADDPRADAPALLSLETGASIQQAVEFLHLTYSYIKQADLDVDEFIGAYTWRPIASMLDMFGTTDLEYTADGEEVVAGIEGFHSRAVGPYSNLFGLVNAEIEDVIGIKRSTEEGMKAARNIDVRAERRQMVEKYITALKFSSAILG